MGAVTRSELRRQEEAVLTACLAQVLNRPIAEVTIKSVAEACDLNLWAAHRAANRAARNRNHLIRRAVFQLGSAIKDQIVTGASPATGIFGTIESWIAHMAGVMEGPSYRNLFRLVVCEGRCHGWLHDMYEEQVADPFGRGLEEAVRKAGRESETAVCFVPGAPRDVLQSLERSLALPMLLPRRIPDIGDRESLVRCIARQAFACSYAWDLGEAA